MSQQTPELFNVEALLRERQDKFVETRTIIETEVNKFMESMAAEEESFRTRCGYTLQGTARDVLPALWQDPFNEAVYQQQLSVVQSQIDAVKTVALQLDEEARRCLQGA